MKLTTLQFYALAELLEFEMKIQSSGHIIDHEETTISGWFIESEIQMAVKRYNASVSETVL
jgi:hypothetical protein